MFNDLDVNELKDLEVGELSPSGRAEVEGAPKDWFSKSNTIAQRHQVRGLQFGIGDWINTGLALAEKHKTATLQWEIGDWFNDCPLPEDMPISFGVPKAYDIAEEVFGISRATLYDWASTAKRIQISVRTEQLPFTHHRAIANGLPDADDETKKRWVAIAVEEKLSVNGLKERLRASRNPSCHKAAPMKAFVVKLPESLYATLHKIARGRMSSVQLVAAEFLSAYLASDDVVAMAEAELAKAEERTYERRRQAGIRTALAYDPLGLHR